MILDIDNDEDFRFAVEALREGRLIAFPTETVYGLGADGLNPDACRRIYEAKGRPSDNPLILHIADLDEIENLTIELPDKGRQLAEAFWPGPLTLVLERSALVSDVVTGGLDTVAVRMPDNELTRRLIRGVGRPLAGPSANVSGKPSPTLAQHVAHDFGERIAGVIEGGACQVGVESTIVDVTVEPPVILRPGGIPREAIEAVIGAVVMAGKVDDDSVPKAPGMKYRHYAPQAAVYRLEGAHRAEKIRTRLSEQVERPVGILISNETLEQLGIVPEDVICWNMGRLSHPEEGAKRLFEGLRRMDAFQVREIYIDTWERTGLGEALMNRIDKLSLSWDELVLNK